uniref:Putative encoded protein n=1 Tax=Dunaliella salina TaxID=3046 RepID=A0A1C8XRL5_DUNSA|nr:putative encoded protein [Dunaliella salina]
MVSNKRNSKKQNSNFVLKKEKGFGLFSKVPSYVTFSQAGNNPSTTGLTRTGSNVTNTQPVQVNTEGVFFNINAPKVMPVSNRFKYSSFEECSFYPVSFG